LGPLSLLEPTPDWPSLFARRGRPAVAGFLRKDGLDSMPMQLGEAISRIATFLGPVITTARGNIAIKRVWMPG
jgi:hypothetical protein